MIATIVARMHRVLLGVVVVASNQALACSGPGARAAMSQAVWIGRGAVAASLVLTVAIVVRAATRKANLLWVAGIVAALLCCLHPGIWVSAYIGDCGTSRIVTSVVMVALHAALGFFALASARR